VYDSVLNFRGYSQKYGIVAPFWGPEILANTPLVIIRKKKKTIGYWIYGGFPKMDSQKPYFFNTKMVIHDLDDLGVPLL